jgi:hypothetical protein
MELKRELALTLFEQERLTLGRASSLAGMSQREFQRLLADRRIPFTTELRNSSRIWRPFAKWAAFDCCLGHSTDPKPVDDWPPRPAGPPLSASPHTLPLYIVS